MHYRLMMNGKLSNHIYDDEQSNEMIDRLKRTFPNLEICRKVVGFNITKIIQESVIDHRGDTVYMTFTYPHKLIKYYMSNGRPCYDYELKQNTVMGCSLEEAKHNVRKYLEAEKYHQDHIVIKRDEDWFFKVRQ